MTFFKILAGANTIAIGGHVRPDGDCVGSCMGMYLYLKEMFPEKQVDIYLQNIPEALKILDRMDEICEEIPTEKEYDLFICQDCGDKERLGFSAPLFDSAKHTFCIDHHISNKEFAEFNYVVPEASSTSELVYNLLDEEKISCEVAKALYLGIVHDTGVFQYSCATPSTFRAAAKLLEKEIDAPKMIQETYYEKTFAQNQILGYALMNAKLHLEGKCISSVLSKSDMEQYGVNAKDLDGIVSHLRNTSGVEVAVFMYELDTEGYKVSLRASGDVDVSSISQMFGGGGHRKAAGFSMSDEPVTILDKVLEQIELQLRR